MGLAAGIMGDKQLAAQSIIINTCGYDHMKHLTLCPFLLQIFLHDSPWSFHCIFDKGWQRDWSSSPKCGTSI